MTTRRIGVGLIGVTPNRSWSALAHIPALRSLPDYEIRALSTTRQASADEAARYYSIPKAFDNGEALITCPDVDLVVVTVKVPHHHALVMSALEAGKSVYCEWPLGNSLEGATAMTELARRKGVHVVVGLQARSSPVINRVRDLINQGYVGRVLSASMVASGVNWGAVIDQRDAYTQYAENGATMLTIPFGHTVDALCYCLGEFHELSATAAVRRETYTLLNDGISLPLTAHDQYACIGSGETLPVTVPDQLAVDGVLDNGVVVSIHFRGGSSRGTNLLWEINGTEGDLQVTGVGGLVEMLDLFLAGGRALDPTVQPLEIPPEYRWVPANAPTGFGFNVAQAYARLARDIREGTHTSPTFEQALTRHRMLSAVVAAAASGRRQRC